MPGRLVQSEYGSSRKLEFSSFGNKMAIHGLCVPLSPSVDDDNAAVLQPCFSGRLVLHLPIFDRDDWGR